MGRFRIESGVVSPWKFVETTPDPSRQTTSEMLIAGVYHGRESRFDGFPCMFKRFLTLTALATVLATAVPAAAQQTASTFGPPVTVCGQQVAPPVAQPPPGSAPVVYLLAPCFAAHGN